MPAAKRVVHFRWGVTLIVGYCLGDYACGRLLNTCATQIGIKMSPLGQARVGTSGQAEMWHM
jgi:hypothetical protein